MFLILNPFLQNLLNKIRLKDNFYLLGYEMGVPVVLEIAAILEKHGNVPALKYLLRQHYY